MYYMKHSGKKLYLESDNVYTQCPRCGKERPVDLADVVVDGTLDLYGTAWYCAECGEKARRQLQEGGRA